MAAAYAALVSLMHIIHKIEHHHSPPISLDKKQAQSLTQNITFLQGFLESYNPPVSDDDESADPLEMRIADAAYAAEDVIESHIVDTIQLRSSSSSRPKLTRLFNCLQYSPQKVDEQIKFNQNLQQAVEEMDSIKKIAMSIDTQKTVVPTVVASSSSSSTFSNTTNGMVGFDDVSLEIMDKLTGNQPDLQVIPIAGMGGIGKTTLAKNIYERKGIKDHFGDYTAWATISQQYNSREILCEVYSQVTKTDKKQLSGMSEAGLGTELHKYLFGRRFLIVMDDMWSIDSWNEVHHFFPNNQNGSRILVTTRLYYLSFQLNNENALFMDFLDEANSWNLFSKTVFGDKCCPPKLEKIGKKIVESCRGLPLSILVVGGLLKKTDATKRCWESVGINLSSVVNLENEKHFLRLLRLSYNHLPVHVKPCFLYMGVFEEDAEISVSTLYKLWISEGFLKPMNEESLETSAIWYLTELVDRNLVQISELGSIGNLKSCKVHDLLRDLCLEEGQKYGFYHVIGSKSSPRGINSQRRVVIPRNASKRKVLGDLRSMPHVRSVICENGKVPRCQNIGLLRTFHAYKFRNFEDKSYKHSLVFQYFNLRHLAVEGRNVSSFLSSVSLLWNLHTIIISCSRKSTTIPEIWKMPQLRHVEFVSDCLCLPDPPNMDGRDDAIIIMENLHTLKGVRNFKCCKEVVKRIPNIKKMKIQFDGMMGANLDEYYGISNIKLLCNLESLSVSCSPSFRGSRYLYKLTFSNSLNKVCLDMNGNSECEGMLEKIGSLPLLEKLKLYGGCFKTGKWEIVEGQFPNLKYLNLYCCLGLENWITAEDSVNIFPCLQQIELYLLKDLKNIPREIGEIPTLEKMLLTGCSEGAVKSAKEIVDEQVEFQGDELPFRVVVELTAENRGLQSLADKNFEVRYREGMRRVEILYAYALYLSENLKKDEANRRV